jgi:hypothetical protein
MEPLPEKDGMKRFYPSLKIIPQTLDRTFSSKHQELFEKVLDVLMKTP